MHRYNRIAGPIIGNRRKNIANSDYFLLNTIRKIINSNGRAEIIAPDCDCDIENHQSLTMVVVCQPLLLSKAHKKLSNQRLWKIILLLQNFCLIIANFSTFFPQTTDIRAI